MVLLGNGYNENFDGYIAFMKKFSAVQLDFANLYEQTKAGPSFPLKETNIAFWGGTMLLNDIGLSVQQSIEAKDS